MTDQNIAKGTVIDEESTLTLEDLAGACRVETQWIVELVEEGVLTDQAGEPSRWRFRGSAVTVTGKNISSRCANRPR